MASLMKNIFYTLAETLNYNLNLRSIEQFDDIVKQINYLQECFELPDPSEVFAILDYCYVYDNRYQCQVCRQLRRINSPLELKQTIETPWRCKSCLLLTA